MKPRPNARGVSRSAGWQSVTAWQTLALVLVLVVCAASPQAHAWLHGREFVVETFGPSAPLEHTANAPVSADDEAGCVITQFAQGWVAHVLAFLAILALIGRLIWVLAVSPVIFPSASIGALPRCCGPPGV